AERVRPRGVAGNVVDAYAQDLGVKALETRLERLVLGHLDASGGRPGRGVERDHDVLPAQLAELDVAAQVAPQLEVGRFVADFKGGRLARQGVGAFGNCHSAPPVGIGAHVYGRAGRLGAL